MEKMTREDVGDRPSSPTSSESAIEKESKQMSDKGKKKPIKQEAMEGSSMTETSTSFAVGLDNPSFQDPRGSTAGQMSEKMVKSSKWKSSHLEDKPNEPFVPAVEQVFPSTSKTYTEKGADANQAASGPPGQNNVPGPSKKNVCSICNSHCMKRSHMRNGAYPIDPMQFDLDAYDTSLTTASLKMSMLPRSSNLKFFHHSLMAVFDPMEEIDPRSQQEDYCQFCRCLGHRHKDRWGFVTCPVQYASVFKISIESAEKCLNMIMGIDKVLEIFDGLTFEDTSDEEDDE